MDLWIRESRIEVFLCDDGYWKKQIKEYSKLKMMKPQYTWDIKNLF